MIVLEQTVVKFGMMFKLSSDFFIGIVLWSIGGSFVLLAAFVASRLPARVIGLMGIFIIAGHNLLDRIPPDVTYPFRPVVDFLMRPGMFPLTEKLTMFQGYPLIPWLGVIAAGYWLGGIFGLESSRRRRILVSIGLGAIVLFCLLRSTGIYGDPSPWKRSGSAIMTGLSFLNCTKYAPSLQFLLMTLGPALLALAAFDRPMGTPGRPLVTLGRVPLFYYLMQWYVIHALAVVVAMARGKPTGWLFVNSLPVQPPPDCTFSLPAVYGWWIVVVLILYGPCAWFAGVKRRNKERKWLSYL